MKLRLRSIVGGGLALTALLATTVLAPSVATASTSNTCAACYQINYKVKASTTLKKLSLTVTVPPGTFKGSINLNNFVLQGKLSLPPASTTINLAGIGLATATFKLSEAKEVTGKVDLDKSTVTATSTFNVLVTSVEPLGLPVNLVGNSCGTSKPVSVTFSGKFSLSGPSKLSGDYTIPPLQDCELATPALNLVMAGPDNVFTASFAPAS